MAVATIIARSFAMIISLSFTHFRHHLISFKAIKIKTMLISWKSIIKLGIPGITVQLMPQLLRSIMLVLISLAGGTIAIAAVAIGTRIESFVAPITYGLSLSLIPIIGQNWGAKKYDRVNEAKKYAIIFGQCYLL